MKRILALHLMLFFTLLSWGHPWKPSHYVIVDTDGGLDDLKALCMLLASPDVRVLAVTVSDGYNDEGKAFDNVSGMLKAFHHEGLPTAHAYDACKLIAQTLSNESSPVTFISLGSLRTAAKAISTVPEFRKKIKQVIWTNDEIEDKDSFNYRYDPEAAITVLGDTIPVHVTGAGGENFYDEKTKSSIKDIGTPYAQKVSGIIESHSGHRFVCTAYDEMVPLMLHYPSLFSITDHGNNAMFLPKDTSALRQACITILSGATVKKMQVMKSMPSDTSFFMPDIQPAVEDIIKRYGEDEWTSGVIANELHRHLGVFAIIGVKMGIRARDYFCTGVDEFYVTSYAGSTPPLSCMNDGIQVSTGATPGHGLLYIPDKGSFSPSAEFTHNGKTIRLTLKKELADKISSELKEINFIYGLDSNTYWELVRRNTIKYWQLFDRNEIFDIQIVNNDKK